MLSLQSFVPWVAGQCFKVLGQDHALHIVSLADFQRSTKRRLAARFQSTVLKNHEMCNSVMVRTQMRPGWCFYKIYDPGLTGTTVFILGLYTIVKSLYLLAGTHPGSNQMINISHRWFQWSRLKKIVLTSSLHVVVASFFSRSCHDVANSQPIFTGQA